MANKHRMILGMRRDVRETADLTCQDPSAPNATGNRDCRGSRQAKCFKEIENALAERIRRRFNKHSDGLTGNLCARVFIAYIHRRHWSKTRIPKSTFYHAFVKKINALYRLQELRDRFKAAYCSLGAKCAEAADELLPEITADDANFDKVTKTKSCGTTGTVDFIVGYDRSIVRLDGKDDKDQEWLSGIRRLFPFYAQMKYELNRAAIKNDLKTGILDEAVLREIELENASTIKLKLSAAIDESELKALADRAADELVKG